MQLDDLAVGPSAHVTIAHGLTVKPKMVLARLHCTADDNNYVTGDTVELGSGTAMSPTGHTGHAIKTDATNLIIRFGSQANIYNIPDGSSGNTVGITLAKWSISFIAYA